ncbi:hypothetical protein IWW43_005012 [Coemansia sp. RSA 1935]|nr:hypothetical protein IWW43_005012 [Coemansia sp. RSA 1935]
MASNYAISAGYYTKLASRTTKIAAIKDESAKAIVLELDAQVVSLFAQLADADRVLWERSRTDLLEWASANSGPGHCEASKNYMSYLTAQAWEATQRADKAAAQIKRAETKADAANRRADQLAEELAAEQADHAHLIDVCNNQAAELEWLRNDRVDMIEEANRRIKCANDWGQEEADMAQEAKSQAESQADFYANEKKQMVDNQADELKKLADNQADELKKLADNQADELKKLADNQADELAVEHAKQAALRSKVEAVESRAQQADELEELANKQAEELYALRAKNARVIGHANMLADKLVAEQAKQSALSSQLEAATKKTNFFKAKLGKANELFRAHQRRHQPSPQPSPQKPGSESDDKSSKMRISFLSVLAKVPH